MRARRRQGGPLSTSLIVRHVARRICREHSQAAGVVLVGRSGELQCLRSLPSPLPLSQQQRLRGAGRERSFTLFSIDIGDNRRRREKRAGDGKAHHADAAETDEQDRAINLGSADPAFRIAPVLIPAFLLGAAATVGLGYGASSIALAATFIGLIGVFMGLGTGGAIALAATIYPTPIRSTGAGWGMAMGRFGQIIGPLIAGALLGAGWTAGPIMTVTA